MNEHWKNSAVTVSIDPEAKPDPDKLLKLAMDKYVHAATSSIEYLEQLNSMPDEDKQRWLDGDWDE